MSGADGEVVEQDQRLHAALATAEVYPLLCAVAHLTGDFDLLREDLALDQGQLLVPGHGLTPEQEASARQLAGDALRARASATAGAGTGRWAHPVSVLRFLRSDYPCQLVRRDATHIEP